MTGERWAILAVTSAARRAIRDPAPLLVAFGFYAIVATVISTLWRIAATTHHGGVAGYSGIQLTWYLYFSEAAIGGINARLIEVVGEDIATGAIAVELLRPASVLWLRVLTETGRSLPRLAGCALIGASLAVLTGGPPPSAAALALAAPSLVLALLCNLVAQHAFAGISFWVRDTKSAWFLYQKLVFVLGAMLLPLEAMPVWMHRLAIWLPFPAMAYAPARLASGHIEPGLIGAQLVWLGLMAAAAHTVFAAGQRRLQVVGG